MTCKDCLHFKVCEFEGVYFEDVAIEASSADGIEDLCPLFENKADFVEVVRCVQCQYAEELDKHCEINRNAYKHCSLWRGDETRNVWHKYKKYYRDYSIVEIDGFCSEGARKEVINNV